MDRREQLHEILLGIVPNVYFQPPASKALTYPCIVYNRSSVKSEFANDKMYNHKIRYQVKLIDPDPDSVFLTKMLTVPLCSFDRHYTSDNLNHDVFNVYY